MTNEEQSINVSFEEYTGDEKPFSPEGIVLPPIILDPLTAFNEQPAYAYKPATPKPIKRTVVINIETTGLAPYKSRITTICCKDASTHDTDLIVWISENEEEMIRNFLEWFEASDYNTLVGYNVAFDLRFILTKAMAYGIQAPSFFNINLDDLAETMKQVRHKYTFGFNKPYKLSDWARYFLNEEHEVDVEGLLTAWAKHDYATVVNYVKKQVDWTYRIWAMSKFVFDELQEIPIEDTETYLEVKPESTNTGVTLTLQPKAETSTTTELKELVGQCQVCLAEITIPEGMQTIVCEICGEIVTR